MSSTSGLVLECVYDSHIHFRGQLQTLLASPQAYLIDPPCKPLGQASFPSGPPELGKRSRTGSLSLCRLRSICRETESLARGQPADKTRALCPQAAKLPSSSSQTQPELDQLSSTAPPGGDLTLCSRAGFFHTQLLCCPADLALP